MNRIRLFLYDNFGADAKKEYEVELKDDIKISITKQFTDLSNPTTIINDWSKTIAIPFTQRNNEIFGMLYRSDRQVTDGAPVGQFDFDASKKVRFRLINDNNVVMTGYMKVLSVEQNSTVDGKYNVTLNGEMGRVFQELRDITFEKGKSRDSHYIDGSRYVYEELTANLIKSSWTSNGQTTSTLIHKGEPDYMVTDYIGFAPSNSYNDGFDYKSAEVNGKIIKLSDELQAKWDSVGFTDYTADSVISKGVKSRGYREFRSYLQIPYIYFNKLFGIFKEKALELTGYNFILDTSWFNEGNPYWYNLVFCLKNFDIKSEAKKYNSYKMSTSTITISREHPTSPAVVFDTTPSRTENPKFWNETYKGFDLVNNNGEKMDLFFVNDSMTTMNIKIENKQDANLDINQNNILYVSLTEYDNAHNRLNSDLYAIVNKTQSTPSVPPATDNILYVDEVIVDNGDRGDEPSVTPSTTLVVKIPILRPMFSRFYGNTDLISYEWGCAYGWNAPLFTDTTIQTSDITFNGDWRIKKYDVKRSYSWFTLNDLWNNDVKLFDVILNYCKMYRIEIILNENDKTIRFISSKEFFKGNTIEDWNDKIDYSKPWKLEPNIVQSKYMLFNYDNSESASLKEYKEETGFNYGEENVDTNYQFDTNTKKLFSGLKQSNVSTDYILDWDSLYNRNDVTHKLYNEQFIDNYGSEDKTVDSFGQFYFFQGLYTFMKEDGVTPQEVSISDDTESQIMASKYVFNSTNSVTVKNYPALSLKANKYLLTFGVPKKSYSVMVFDTQKSLYDNFWRSYMNDLYSINTKKITCYARLTPEDYLNFSFNKFVVVGNQLYMVNKISDYTLNSIDSTKIELISINNINNYIGTSNVWGVSPIDIKRTVNEFIGTTYTYRLFDNDKVDLSKYHIFFYPYEGNIPAGWTKTIRTTRIDDYTVDITVSIESQFVVQRAAEYYFVLEIDKGTLDSQTVYGELEILGTTQPQSQE